MNFLAHAFLSFDNKDLLTGNMISDFVKGKKQFEYPKSVQAGIQLHRAIDEFTDTHPVTKELKQLFRPAYRLYASAMVDVVFDFCLANDSSQFTSEAELDSFCKRTYTQLEENRVLFPPVFASMFPYMKAHDWLYNYRLNEGIRKSLAGVGRRAAYIAETDTAYEIFLSGKKEIEAGYKLFFSALAAFAAHKTELLLRK